MKARKWMAMLLTLALLLGALPASALAEQEPDFGDLGDYLIDDPEGRDAPGDEGGEETGDAGLARTVVYTFLAGEAVWAVQTVADGDELTRPEDPAAPEGYAFAAWCVGSALLFEDDDGDGIIDPEYVYLDEDSMT